MRTFKVAAIAAAATALLTVGAGSAFAATDDDPVDDQSSSDASGPDPSASDLVSVVDSDSDYHQSSSHDSSTDDPDGTRVTAGSENSRQPGSATRAQSGYPGVGSEPTSGDSN